MARRIGFGCIGFIVSMAMGMFIALSILDLAGRFETEDAQIHIFPALIVLPLALLAFYFASRDIHQADRPPTDQPPEVAPPKHRPN